MEFGKGTNILCKEHPPSATVCELQVTKIFSQKVSNILLNDSLIVQMAAAPTVEKIISTGQTSTFEVGKMAAATV